MRHFTRILLTCLSICFSLSVSSQTWKKFAKSGNAGLYDIVFTTKSNGYIMGGTKIYRTTDTGKTWNQILSSYTNFSRMWFTDPNNGYIIGYNDLVLKTTDGGNNWSLKRTGNSDDDLIAVYAKDKDTVFVLGPDDIDNNKFGNYLEYSYNGGSTWTRKSTGSTNTIRSMHMWNKNKGVMGTLTGGIFETTDGFTNYNVNWNVNNIIDMRSIKDSVIIMVGLNGVIFRSGDYGKTYKSITSGTTVNLMGLHFANDSIGMACGEKGVILYTKDAGLSWSKMATGTNMTIYKVFVFNKYYAWACGYNLSGDSIDIFKFGSENYVESKINTVRGSVIADVYKNCKLDAKEIGPAPILIQATPGPYYTYTTAKGAYEIVIPDTGKFTITAILPYKYGGDKNLCDTMKSHTVSFKSFENKVFGKNFFFDSDSSIKLDIDIATSRKRRCGVNLNTITYKNTGFKTVDSTVITLYYSPYTIIKSASQKYTKGNETITFKTGPLAPGQSGVIYVYDSVKCDNPNIRGLSACMRVLITPQVFVTKTNWDGSIVRTKVDCFEDSLAIIKVYNDGNKIMKDSATLDLFLDVTKVAAPKFKLESKDSIKFMMDPMGKMVFVETAVNTQHPYLQKIRVFREGCGDSAGIVSKQQVIKHALQDYPSFEDEACVEIRDSYDPNDITVVPEGPGAKHYIDNVQRLTYKIRFQNTGTDTAYKIVVVDTLANEIDLASIEMRGSSHKFTYSLVNGTKKHVIKFEFNNINLVDSFTNEKGSHGFVTFDVNLNQGLPKGTRVNNFVDIYFDFNTPVRTNTAFNTIYDTVFTSLKPGIAKNCFSKFVKIPRDTVVCDKYEYVTGLKTIGSNQPIWKVNDFLTKLDRLNDTVARIKTVHEGKFIIDFQLQNCENTWYDTATVFFWRTPTIKVKDSIYCGQVNDNIFFSCFACSYLWNNTSTSYNFIVNKPGTYWVKATNLCKSITDTFTLDYLPYLNLDLGRDTLLCNNASLVKNLKLSPGKYLWNDGDNKANKTLNKPGTYWVNFTNKCNNLSDTLVIKQKQSPSLELGKDSVYCGNISHTIVLDSVVGKYAIKWWDGGTQSKRTFTTPGYFTATINNECGLATDGVKLDVLQKPVIDLGRDSIFCSQFRYLVSLPFEVWNDQILWNDGSSDTYKEFTTPGDYSVKVINRCGEARDTILVHRSYVPDFKLDRDTTFCHDFSKVLNATNYDARYLWSTGDTTPTIIVTKPGTYSVTATTVCGTKTDYINIARQNAPVIDLGKDVAVERPFVRVLSAGNPGSDYLWQDGSNGNTQIVDDYGTYWLRVSNNCGIASDTIVFYDPLYQYLNHQISIFPNPSVDGIVNIFYQGGNYSYEVFDQIGRRVLEGESTSRMHSFDISNFNQGIYYVRVYQNGLMLKTEKIIKQ